MALQQNIEFILGTGAVATYWRIAHANCDFKPAEIDGEIVEGVVDVVVQGYATQAARVDGKNHVMSKNYRFSVEQVDGQSGSLGGDFRISLYRLIKTLPAFEGAQDV